jgi:hypothetical protein
VSIVSISNPVNAWLDREVQKAGIPKFLVFLIVSAAGFYQITTTVEPFARAIAVMASLVAVSALLISWVFHGRAERARDELLDNSYFMAVLEQLGFVVSITAACCHKRLPFDSSNAPLPDTRDVRTVEGFLRLENQVVEAIFALLPTADRRFALYYRHDTKLCPHEKHGWASRGTPPELADSTVPELNKIDAQDSFLRDLSNHDSRLIPDVLNASPVDDRVARCARTHLDGDRYRALGWYPICAYKSRIDAMNRKGAAVGGLLVQCAGPGTLDGSLDASLALLANLLGAGYIAAASTLNGERNAS